jgi:hypothetical protein
MIPLRVTLDTDVFVHPVWDSGPVESVSDHWNVQIYVCSAVHSTVQVYYGVVRCIVNYP